jgi:hypothetical protein
VKFPKPRRGSLARPTETGIGEMMGAVLAETVVIGDSRAFYRLETAILRSATSGISRVAPIVATERGRAALQFGRMVEGRLWSARVDSSLDRTPHTLRPFPQPSRDHFLLACKNPLDPCKGLSGWKRGLRSVRGDGHPRRDGGAKRLTDVRAVERLGDLAVETIMTVVGLALALAQAIVIGTTTERWRAFLIATSILLVLGTGWALIVHVRHARSIDAIADQITKLISANRPLSLPQIIKRVNENSGIEVSRDDIAEALELERGRGYACSADLTTKDDGGREYIVQVFAYPNMGTCSN